MLVEDVFEDCRVADIEMLGPECWGWRSGMGIVRIRGWQGLVMGTLHMSLEIPGVLEGIENYLVSQYGHFSTERLS